MHSLSFPEQINYLHYLIGENKAIENSEKEQLILSRVKDAILLTLKKNNIKDFSIDTKIFAILVDIFEDQEEKTEGEKKHDNTACVPMLLFQLPKIVALEHKEDLEKFLVGYVDSETIEKRISVINLSTNFDVDNKNHHEIFIEDFCRKLKKLGSNQNLFGFRKEISEKEMKLDEYLYEYMIESIKGLLRDILNEGFSNPGNNRSGTSGALSSGGYFIGWKRI